MTPSRREFVVLSAAGLASLAGAGGASAHEPRVGTVRLPCGRRLVYAEYGDPAGPTVVVHHHGLPSSRREAEVFAPAACRHPGVRFLAFDRPGIGDSDPVPAPSFRGWACDLLAALDALGVGRFALTGTSGGTPFAFAVALACPERVTRVALACPVAEHQRHRDNGGEAWFLWLCRHSPRTAEALLATGARRVGRKPDAVARLFPLTPAEKAMVRDPADLALVTGFMTDSVKGGPAGPVAEGALLPGPWGLPLDRVTSPTTLFHGTADPIAPCWMSDALARAVPGATARFYPGDGHLSLPKLHADEVFAAALG